MKVYKHYLQGVTIIIAILMNPRNTKHNYLYILKLREFLISNENVYKIGRTTQLPNTRLAGYPKGSLVIMFAEVPDCIKAENKLKEQFDKHYICRRDYGREYYEGNIYLMKSTFNRVIEESDNVKRVEEDSSSEYIIVKVGRFCWRMIFG